MAFDYFSRTKNYSDVLNRIALCTFVTSLVLVHILRETIPSLGAVLSRLPEVGEIMGVKVSLGTILLALFIAFVLRAVRMHDRLSNLLGIRRNFDVQEILVPLAERTIGSPTGDTLVRIARERDRLMDQVFYQYVSSTRDRGNIDSHLIEGALDQWSWFWCLLETAALLIVTAFALAVSGAPDLAAILTVVVAGCVILMIGIRSLCGKNAAKQIEAILIDPERKAKIAEAFHAI